jgi:protein-tyrosine-phosphatase
MSRQGPSHGGPPLFICHANCCRSVLAEYLYRDLTGSPALSAGIEVGERINDRAAAMLSFWGIDATGHRPKRVDRRLCAEAGAIFTMGPFYLAQLIARFGHEIASKSYLFADPYMVPPSFAAEAFLVYDPSFERRPVDELAAEFEWFRRRVAEVHESLSGRGARLVPAAHYLDRLEDTFAELMRPRAEMD